MGIKPWKTLNSRPVYQNRWTSVREDLAEMPNGQTTIYGVVEVCECVGVLPFLDEDLGVMVRQYRYVFGECHRWEMPTGGVKEGESLLETAHRELKEEVGCDAKELQHINTYFPANLLCTRLSTCMLVAV